MMKLNIVDHKAPTRWNSKSERRHYAKCAKRLEGFLRGLRKRIERDEHLYLTVRREI